MYLCSFNTVSRIIKLNGLYVDIVCVQSENNINILDMVLEVTSFPFDIIQTLS